METKSATQRYILTVVLDFIASHYGVRVSEMCRSLPLSHLIQPPQASHPIQGIVDFNGAAIPVFDVRNILGHPPALQTDESRVVVLEARNKVFGITVDAVAGLISIPEEQVTWGTGPGPVCGTALADWQVALLDLARLQQTLENTLGGWPTRAAIARWTARAQFAMV